jgi:transposase
MLYESRVLRPAIQAAFDQGGLDAVCDLVVALLNEQEARHQAEMAAMEARHQAVVAKLEARIAELEKRLNKNSSNSSKPPSSDGLKRKPKSLRPTHTGRKPGGQPGHPGQTLQPSPTPDLTEIITPGSCPHCHTDLRDEATVAVEKRQVFDLPQIRMQVTEHQAQSKLCHHCGRLVSAHFPSGVSAPVQYGSGMQSVMSYLNLGQLLPCERTAEVCQDLFGHRPSAGSVVRAAVQCASHVAPAVEEIGGVLRQSGQLHADETGVRCTAKTHWIHVLATPSHTLYSHSTKRGREGFDAAGVLPDYNGNLVHDFWGAYDTLEHCIHSRCNAHLLRELKAFIELGHPWAQGLTNALLAMKQAADEARAREREAVDSGQLEVHIRDYDRWVAQGLAAHPEGIRVAGRRGGRVKQSPERCLLIRLLNKRDEVLRFAHDLSVPFDNNLAERDLRMIKVQQKVSGCFRSIRGAETFCTVRSYLSTARKQGLNLMDSIKAAFAGSPVDFTT